MLPWTFIVASRSYTWDDPVLSDLILQNDSSGVYTCWMDDDGFHVWQHHMCQSEIVESLLPRGTYKFWTEQDGRVVPSINCEKCGLHENQIPVYKGK